MEIKGAGGAKPDLGLVVCPSCGVKFQRFDPQYLKGAGQRVAAR